MILEKLKLENHEKRIKQLESDLAAIKALIQSNNETLLSLLDAVSEEQSNARSH
jgi:hypothetical protein